MTGKRIGVRTTDGISVRCESANGSYDTLCGIDSDDPFIGHFGIVPIAINTKIDCKACKNIFNTARKYRIACFN